MAGIADVDVDAEEYSIAIVHGNGEGLGEHLVEPARNDLGHLVGAHALLGHPLENFGRRPVAAQSDLQEAITAGCAGLDKTPHRLAMADERAELDIARVGMRIEVNDRDPAPAASSGHAGAIGPGDGVVTSEHERDCTARRDLLDDLLKVAAGARSIAAEHLDIPRIDNPDVLEPVDAHGERGARAVMREVARRSHRAGPKSCPAAIRGAAVEGRPHDHHVGIGK